MGTLRLEFSDGGDRPRIVGSVTLPLTGPVASSVAVPDLARVLVCDALDVAFYVAAAPKGSIANAAGSRTQLVRPGRPSKFILEDGASVSAMLAGDVPGSTVAPSGGTLDFSDPANSGHIPGI